MAKQTAKVSLSSALGSRGAKAFETSKNNEVKYDGGGELPALQGGVAELTSMTISTYKQGPNQGKPFFRAAGVVLKPKSVKDSDGNTIPVAGLQTSIMIPLCDTKTQKGEVTKMEEHLEKMINEVKKFGVDLSEVSIDDFESTMEALVETKPQFKFRVWMSKATKEYPNPRANHVWNGVLGEDEELSDSDGESSEEDSDVTVDDESVEESETEEGGESEGSEEEGGEESTEGGYEVDEEKIDALLVKANKKDKKAQAALITLAVEAGHSQEDAENAESWDDVASLAKNPAGSGEEGGEEGESEEIGVGSQVQYRPVDPKTKKPGKAVDCEIVKENKDGTFSLKNMVDGKTIYNKVDKDSLIS